MYKISSLKSKCKIFKIDLLVRHLYTKLKMNVDLLKRLCTQKVFNSLGEKKLTKAPDIRFMSEYSMLYAFQGQPLDRHLKDRNVN